MIKELKILGLRSFGKEQIINFSLPNKEKNESGLNIIVGPNNSGKTTIMEAITAFNSNNSPTFSEGKRNNKSKNFVHLSLTDENNTVVKIDTLLSGGSETTKNILYEGVFYSVPSRRSITQDFHKDEKERDVYVRIYQKSTANREYTLNSFNARIFDILKNKSKFDQSLKKVMGYEFDWTVEQRDNGQYYIKCINNGLSHSGEGIGDGIWSAYTICASLFDSKEGDTIIIDEPELSLHPAFQKRLLKLIKEYAEDRQIIIFTHSAHFIDWDEIIDKKASLMRVIKEENDSIIYKLSEDSIRKLNSCRSDYNNPHLFGLEASEALFADDRIIVCEGQEDIIGYRKIADELNIEINGEFYGWGSGGASKINVFLQMLSDLGFKHVVAIFDGDKADEATICEKNFANYKVLVLEKEDIRDKRERIIKGKEGIVTENFKLKEEFREYVNKFINEINESLK